MPRVDHLNHRPDEAGIKKIEKLRLKIIELDTMINDLVPVASIRERALALTNLEQVRMWAVKGIVMPYPVDEIS